MSPLTALRPSSYPELSDSDLKAELGSVAERLSEAFTELSAVKSQYIWLYHQGYRASHETSHAGKDVHGRQAALEIEEDQIRLQGNIDSLTVLRDLLVTLLHAR